MSKARTQTPAPEGQQGPPTRAMRGALRDARGSLPLTSGTACVGANLKDAKPRKEIARCWYEGYRAGRRGEPMRGKPYETGTPESWSWVGGHIAGKDRRMQDAARFAELDGTREH